MGELYIIYLKMAVIVQLKMVFIVLFIIILQFQLCGSNRKTEIIEYYYIAKLKLLHPTGMNKRHDDFLK